MTVQVPSVRRSTAVAAVQSASGSGAEFANLLAIAKLESGLRPDAHAATSSATGLFQFVGQTWLEVVRQYGAAHGLAAEAASIVSRNGRLTVEDPALRQHILELRKDPRLSAALAADNLRAIGAGLAGVLGRAPDPAELYLGHFLGAGGAVRMLRALQAAPGEAAANVLPRAAEANPALFSPHGQPCSVAQFMDRVRSRLAQAYADSGMIVPALGPSAPGGAPALPDWSAGVPQKLATPETRVMLSRLTAIFLEADRANAAANENARRKDREQAHALPASVVAALAPNPGITSPEPATAVPPG